jgi:hypothetical protein
LDYQQVTLETLNSGAVIDLFEAEWRKLLNNIQDPNTKPDAVRKVKIEIAVKPAKSAADGKAKKGGRPAKAK